MKNLMVLIWALTFSLGTATMAFTAPVAILNADFESPALNPPGVWYNAYPANWAREGTLDNLGVIWQEKAFSPPPSTSNQLGYLWDGAMYQVLNADLLSSSLYTLTIQVGYSDTGYAAGPYTVELWAGTTLLAAIDESDYWPSAGQFDTAVLNYQSSSSVPDDQQLKIRLTGHGSPVGSANIVFFDDLILDVVPIPIPTTVCLLGSGLICLVGFRRKRQR